MNPTHPSHENDTRPLPGPQAQQPPPSTAGRTPFTVATIIILIAAAAFGSGALARLRKARSREEFRQSTSEVVVETARVHPRTAAPELILPATVSAVHQTTLNARANGYISRWLVDIGDTVKEGQVLAEIVDPDLDQQLAAARHELQQAVANFELAKVTARRSTELVKTNVISLQEDDINQANLRATKATVETDQANVDRFIALEGFKTVTAPFAGRVTERLIDVGTLVTAGSGTSGTPLYTVAATNPLNIFVSVPQSNAPDIRTGMTAQLLVPEYPDRVFTARVVRTATALDPLSRTLNTEMQIANDDGALYAGMYARIRFTLPSQGAPIIMPANAFVFGKDGARVAVVTNDRRVHWQKIQPGRDFGNELEVLSGLHDGDSVILNPADDLEETLIVTPRPISPAL